MEQSLHQILCPLVLLLEGLNRMVDHLAVDHRLLLMLTLALACQPADTKYRNGIYTNWF